MFKAPGPAVIAISNNEGACGVAATAAALGDDRAALDAIEAGIRLVEASEEVRTVGRGGWPNLLGEVELDASVMDGTSLQTGAVGALTGYLHPVSIARQVLERLPHELLVGESEAAPASHPCEIIAISDDPAPRPTAPHRYEQMGL